MARLKKAIKDMPIRRAFTICVLVTISLIIFISLLTFIGLFIFRGIILPDSNAVYLTVIREMEDGSSIEFMTKLEYGDKAESASVLLEADSYDSLTGDIKYSVKKVETSYSQMSKKRKFAYQVSGLAMVAMPILYSLSGVLICGFCFYNYKLRDPIHILESATREISDQNLDFQVYYNSDDELGRLCTSFEKMRSTLYHNNRKMWSILEERKLMQASLAHDLRNPLAIIEGYTEYLLLNISEESLDKDRLTKIAGNLNMAAKRMETYTDSIREISSLDEIEIKPTAIEIRTLLDEVELDFQMISAQKKIEIKAEDSVALREVKIDEQILYRILKNILNNALSYAKEKVEICFNLSKDILTIEIIDDGPGFPLEVITGKGLSPYTSDETGQHMGIGLVVSRILCQKHGGQLEVRNREEGGAYVKITLQV